MSWRRRRSRADYEDEIRSHLEHEADALVKEGMTRAAARAEARARFGDLSRALPPPGPEGGGGRTLAWVAQFGRDTLYALRTLRREKGFAAVTILTLVLGIGMNSAIFTFMYSLTMRGLPLPDADRLVTVHQTFAGMPLGRFGDASMKVGSGTRHVDGTSDMVSYEEYRAYRDRSHTLSGLAGFASLPATLAGEPAHHVSTSAVTCDYFQVLGAPLRLGRGLEPGDCRSGGRAPVVVLGYGLWRSRFGGDPDVVGRSIRLNQTSFTVVGVAAQGFTGTTVLQEPDLWIPVTMESALGPDRLDNADLSWLSLIGRLTPDATVDRAAADLTSIGRSRDTAYSGRRTTVLVREATVAGGPVFSGEIWSLKVAGYAIAGLILLIACLNVASLMLARIPGRQRAVRIRRALGAARHQVVGQLLVESLLLALVGGSVGLGLSLWLPGVFGRMLLPGGLPMNSTPDFHVVGYALGVCCLAATLFGLVPSLETSRVDLAAALRGDTAGTGRGPHAFRLRQGVVAAQLAGSLLLLVVAGLFGRSLVRSLHADPGFRIDHVYGFRPNLKDEGYSTEQEAAFYDEWKSRVAALPGLASVALASFLPLTGQSSAVFMRDPNATVTDFGEGQAFHIYVSPEYFATLGIPILRGSGLPTSVPAPGEPLPAVISETMAKRYWPDQEPIGQVFAAPTGVARRVLGIARDALHGGLRTEGRAFFWSAIPHGGTPRTLVVHSIDDRQATAEVLKAAREVDPRVLVTVTSLRDTFDRSLRPTRMTTFAAGALGMLALLLGVVGMYGAVAYGASQRAHEFGVRVALGAKGRDIRWLVVRQGAIPLGIGLVAGLTAAALVARTLRSRLYEIPPLDPIVFSGMAVVLILVAGAAMLRPARRASSVDPAETLRAD